MIVSRRRCCGISLCLAQGMKDPRVGTFPAAKSKAEMKPKVIQPGWPLGLVVVPGTANPQ